MLSHLFHEPHFHILGIMVEDYIGYPITSVGLSFDSQCLLVASQDSVVRLFDYGNGELLNRYTGHVNKDYRYAGEGI